MTLVDVEAALVSEHGRAFSLAYLLCGDSSTAEEVAAECFARVWARCQRGDVVDPAAYLRRAIVNEVTSVFRRRRVERLAKARLAMDDVHAPDYTKQSSDRAALKSALQQLPPRQRAVVVLRYFDDLSEAAIATTMGTSVGTTKAHLSRGLATLRRLLEDEEEQ